MRQWLSHVKVNDGSYSIGINGGKITDLLPSERAIPEGEPVRDAGGLLMLPTLRDGHVHLDKSFPRDVWVSRRRVGSLLEQFRMEKDLLMLNKDRQLELARLTLDDMLEFGTTQARVHVDIDPEIGLSHVENILRVREEYSNNVKMELVAFPQQGLIRSDSVPFIKEAMRRGVEVVGGVDPAGVDRNIDKVLYEIFDMAVEFGAEVDVHLHDPGHLGAFTIERMLDYTEQARWQGRVTVSHAYCLGELDSGIVGELADRLAAQQVSVVTSVPIDTAMPPVALLASRGVRVTLGTDHTGLDVWTPYGDADVLKRGRRLAEKGKWNDDDRMRSVYGWMAPHALEFREGDDADFMLVGAMNPQHALAAAPPREWVYVKGTPVAGRRWIEARK